MTGAWFLTDRGALAAASLLTLLAVLENGVLPWSPFYVLYAAAAVALPLRLGTYRFGSPRRAAWWHWLLAVGAVAALHALGGAIFGGVVPLLWGDVLGDPYHDVTAALAAVWHEAAARLDLSPATVRTIYLVFIFVWAGIGEELCYRGYLQGVLRRRHGAATAVLTASAFFAVRHAAQFGLLWPDYPTVAAAAWVTFAFLFGLAMGALYERTGSLTLPVFIHVLFNAPALAAGLAAG
jgi:membrane protease YdiL (CAAX protease family)